METETEIEIQVRTLTGESITVSISPNRTIQDLKFLLTKTFPPASSSPNFHLFLKATKLHLQSRISSNLPTCGEFIVLIPFSKKERQCTPKPCENETASENFNQCSTSKLAESAWSDMMQDLSSLKDIRTEETQTSENPSSQGKGEVKMRNFKSGFSREVGEFITVLQSSGNTKFDENNCERFIQMLESITCLCDPQSGTCMLKNTNVANDSIVCACPPWLKVFLKSFYFINIYSGFLQLKQKTVTKFSLEEGLDQLGKFGFEIRYADLENLSIFCPQVIQFVNNETEARKLRNALVVSKSSMDPEERGKVKKSVPTSRIVDSIEKRERTFKRDLCGAVKLVMNKDGAEMVKSCSLEEFFLYVKEGSHKAKRTWRSLSEPSISFASEAQCNETNLLGPAEMIEHLRKGIGSRGQIVHVEEISGRKANFFEIPSYLSEITQSILKSFGIPRLYSHQAESIQASLAGKNVVVATMTSSGKSLCYNLPVLEVLSQNLLACALYLFPTKALAQDQLRALLLMTKDLNLGLNIGIYDGDTCQEDRMWLRDNSS